LVELNVQEQCINMLNNPDVQKAVKTRNLKVHAWVFDIASGKIIDLGIDFDHEQSKIASIYQVD